jgi:hypothetical protein
MSFFEITPNYSSYIKKRKCFPFVFIIKQEEEIQLFFVLFIKPKLFLLFFY